MEVLSQRSSIRHALIQRYSSLGNHILRESICSRDDFQPLPPNQPNPVTFK